MNQIQPLCFCTGNKHKIEEFSQLVDTYNNKLDNDKKINFITKSFDVYEIQGDPCEVSKSKCEQAAKIYNGPVVTEDVSFVIESWSKDEENLLPGVYIKYFLKSVGPEGIVKMSEQFENKKCYAQCIYAYTDGPNQPVQLFIGQCHGKLVNPRGVSLFGKQSFDCIIECDCNGKTYGEMTVEQKNEISHRGVAARKFMDWYTQQISK